nr:hypothetical protein [Halomicroarcula sp. ZS-22-S1]
MESGAWQSVDVNRNNEGVPHVLKQNVAVDTSGPTEASSGYTKPTIEHRLVPLTEFTKFGTE